MMKKNNPTSRNDYLIRSIYRDLIRKLDSQNRDTELLRGRLNDLEEEKWGNTVQGVSTVRRVSSKAS